LEETENDIEEKGERLNKRFCGPDQIGNFSFTEGKNNVLRRVVTLRKLFLDLTNWDSRSAKVTKMYPRSQKMTLQGVGNTGIIDFPTSPKSQFWLCRRQKMNKKGKTTS
jgi:hypothetical protein